MQVKLAIVSFNYKHLTKYLYVIEVIVVIFLIVNLQFKVSRFLMEMTMAECFHKFSFRYINVSAFKILKIIINALMKLCQIK